MGRTSKATAQKPSARKVGRPSASPRRSVAKAPAKPAKPAVVAKREQTSAAPKLSKDALRAELDKRERENATLRAKRKEANRAAKTSTARITELEAKLADLEKRLASSAAPPKRASRPPRAPRQPREVDPGDAVPPGVAVQAPASLDEEAESALENLDRRLGE